MSGDVEQRTRARVAAYYCYYCGDDDDNGSSDDSSGSGGGGGDRVAASTAVDGQMHIAINSIDAETTTEQTDIYERNAHRHSFVGGTTT